MNEKISVAFLHRQLTEQMERADNMEFAAECMHALLEECRQFIHFISKTFECENGFMEFTVSNTPAFIIIKKAKSKKNSRALPLVLFPHRRQAAAL
jgi:hypothetical protein